MQTDKRKQFVNFDLKIYLYKTYEIKLPAKKYHVSQRKKGRKNIN